MISKRLIGVVTVKNGWAVQSVGYSSYLPLGKPEIIAENLGRWGVDEVLLQCIDRSTTDQGPDFDTLKKVSLHCRGTPLIYSGGIQTVQQGINVIKNGADRLAVDHIMHDAPVVLEKLSLILGLQALIGCFPLSIQLENVKWFDYKNRLAKDFPAPWLHGELKHFVSEIMVIDYENEGSKAAFDLNLIENLKFSKCNLIPCGGANTSEIIKKLFQYSFVSAVAIGNSLNYEEHAVNKLKTDIDAKLIRKIDYEELGIGY